MPVWRRRWIWIIDARQTEESLGVPILDSRRRCPARTPVWASDRDRVFDRVDVDFAVADDYDSTVAEFRARYPQFRDTAVEKRLAQVVTPPT